MTLNNTTLLSWQRGTLPDRYWYQLNGKSATDNYAKQKQVLAEADSDELVITSEVSMK